MTVEEKKGLTRRELLKRAASLSALALVGANFICAPTGAWAMDVKVIKPDAKSKLDDLADWQLRRLAHAPLLRTAWRETRCYRASRPALRTRHREGGRRAGECGGQRAF